MTSLPELRRSAEVSKVFLDQNPGAAIVILDGSFHSRTPSVSGASYCLRAASTGKKLWVCGCPKLETEMFYRSAHGIRTSADFALAT